MRALVVDDSQAMRFLVGRMLQRLGFDVLEAADGKAALAVLEREGPVELACIDWNMPEMNGLDLVKALRQEHRFDAMRIMMVTTEIEMPQVARALEAGANEYLMKPFTKEAFGEKLTLLGMPSQPCGAG